MKLLIEYEPDEKESNFALAKCIYDICDNHNAYNISAIIEMLAAEHKHREFDRFIKDVSGGVESA